MKKPNTKILDEIIGNLRHFFNESETDNLHSMLLEEIKSNKYFDLTSETQESQLQDEKTEGSDLRFEVDRFLTFTHYRTSIETFQKLTLAIAENLIYKGEFEIGEEIINGNFQNKEDIRPGIAADMLLLQAKIAWNRSDWKSCEEYCNEAFDIYSSLENQKGMCSCQNMLGNISGEMGDLNKASLHYKKGLECIKEQNNEMNAMLHTNLGIIANMQGNLSLAEEYYSNALELYKQLDNDFQLGRLNHNLGMLNLQKAEYNKALNFFDNSINLSMANSHHSNYALSLAGKATVLFKQGNYELSGSYADKAFEVSYKINDRLTIAEVYRIKGLIQQELKNLELADEYISMSIRLNENFSNEYNLAESSIDLSKIYYELKHKEQADKLVHRATAYYKEQNINLHIQ